MFCGTTRDVVPGLEGGGGEGWVWGEDEVVEDVDGPRVPGVEADEEVDGGRGECVSSRGGVE